MHHCVLRRRNIRNNKNTDSFNKIQKEINNINSTFLHGKNKKLVLDSKQLSLKWYEYSVGYAYNTEKCIGFKTMFSGKAEAVKGFIEGIKTGLSILNT